MTEQKLVKKIEEQAIKFRARALTGLADEKRHDQIQQDEKKWMWTAHNKLGFSFAKIGGLFDRDPRTVKQAIETYRPNRRQVGLASNQDPFIIEAKRKHLNEIETILTSWRDEIDAAQSFCRYEVVYQVEEEPQLLLSDEPGEGKKNPLFPYTLQHCPSVADKWRTLKTQRGQYGSIMEELSATIDKEAPPEATEYFGNFAAIYAVRAALGQGLPDYKRGLGFLRVHERRCEWAIASGNAGEEVLNHCQEQHEALIGKYKNDPKVVELLAIREQLCDSQKILYETIEETLIKRSYIKFKCGACPDFGAET